MCTWVNEDTLEMMKNCFLGANQIKKCPKTVSCKECTYVQKDKNGKDEKIDPPVDTEKKSSRHMLLINLIIQWKVLK